MNRRSEPHPAELLQWFVVKTAAHKEFAVERVLKEAGFATFVPVETKWRRKCSYVRKRIKITYPLLLRYVVVGFPLGETPWYYLGTIWRWQSILGIVCFNGEPARIPGKNVKAMAQRYQSGFTPSAVPPPHRAFKIGDHVEVAEGPLTGRQCKIESIKGEKAKILVELFGSTHPVDIPLASLEAA